jgi:hypothetical protein
MSYSIHCLIKLSFKHVSQKMKKKKLGHNFFDEVRYISMFFLLISMNKSLLALFVVR